LLNKDSDKYSIILFVDYEEEAIFFESQ